MGKIILNGVVYTVDININDEQPTFTEAQTRANIQSGESVSTLFGKIKKWFTDLKSVAFSGSYNDLSDTPDLTNVAHTNASNDFSVTQSFSSGASVQANDPAPLMVKRNSSGGAYVELENSGGVLGRIGVNASSKPVFYDTADHELALLSNLATVATSGSYNDLLNKPTIPTVPSLPLSIGNGGTGANTRLNAAKNLTNEAVSSPGWVVGLTSNWGKFGYTSLAELKTAMALNNVNNTADANKSVKSATTASRLATYTNNYLVTARTSWQSFTVTASANIVSVMVCPANRLSGNPQWYVTWSGKVATIYYKNTTDWSADGYNIWIMV